MQEASLQGVLRVILIILLIYYGLKVVTRLFGPLLFRYVTKKAGQKFQQHFEQYQHQQDSHTDDVIIDKKNARKYSNKDVGEYVDYEEVD